MIELPSDAELVFAGREIDGFVGVVRTLVNEPRWLFQNGTQDAHALRRSLQNVDGHTIGAVENVMVARLGMADDEKPPPQA